MEDTLALIARSHEGDKKARDTVFHNNIGLLYNVAKRFTGRGTELEDLIQIGSIGLLKAIDRFDLNYQVCFSTYAVPMISGEIRRFLRDDGMLQVSRSIKENGYKIRKEAELMEKEMGREITLLELSQKLKIAPEEIAMAIAAGAEVESLQKTVYKGDGTEIVLQDKIMEKTNPQEEILNKILLENILKKLEKKEQKLILLRYFHGKTQTETAMDMGISQVQVSRMEKKILSRMKKECLKE